MANTIIIAGKTYAVGTVISPRDAALTIVSTIESGFAKLISSTEVQIDELPLACKFENGGYLAYSKWETKTYTVIDVDGNGTLKDEIILCLQQVDAAQKNTSYINASYSNKLNTQEALNAAEIRYHFLSNARAQFMGLLRGKDIKNNTASTSVSNESSPDGKTPVATASVAVTGSVQPTQIQQATSVLNTATASPIPGLASMAGQGVTVLQKAVADGHINQEIANGPLAAMNNMANMDPSNATNKLLNHYEYVNGNGVLVTNAINATVNPDSVGSPARCSSISDYLGSIQNKFSSLLSSISSNINSLITSILAIPKAIISGFADAVSAVISAVTSGIGLVVKAATAALNTALGAFNTALGSGGSLIGKLSSSISSLSSGVDSEISNISNSIQKFLNNTFNINLPNVSPCMNQAAKEYSNVDKIKPQPATDNVPAAA